MTASIKTAPALVRDETYRYCGFRGADPDGFERMFHTAFGLDRPAVNYRDLDPAMGHLFDTDTTLAL